MKPARKIVELNEIIKKYAVDKGFIYLDYYANMVDKTGGLKAPDFTSPDDLVHPNQNGYKVMESLVKKAIEQALKE